MGQWPANQLDAERQADNVYLLGICWHVTLALSSASISNVVIVHCDYKDEDGNYGVLVTTMFYVSSHKLSVMFPSISHSVVIFFHSSPFQAPRW